MTELHTSYPLATPGSKPGWRLLCTMAAAQRKAHSSGVWRARFLYATVLGGRAPSPGSLQPPS